MDTFNEFKSGDNIYLSLQKTYDTMCRFQAKYLKKLTIEPNWMEDYCTIKMDFPRNCGKTYALAKFCIENFQYKNEESESVLFWNTTYSNYLAFRKQLSYLYKIDTIKTLNMHHASMIKDVYGLATNLIVVDNASTLQDNYDEIYEAGRLSMSWNYPYYKYIFMG